MNVILIILVLWVAVQEHLLRTSDDFVWQVDAMSHGHFTIDVEFLDLRIATNNASTYLALCFNPYSIL